MTLAIAGETRLPIAGPFPPADNHAPASMPDANKPTLSVRESNTLALLYGGALEPIPPSREEAAESKFRTLVIKNAESLSKSRLHFRSFHENSFSESAWKPVQLKTSDGRLQTGWEPRNGDSAKAVNDFFKNPDDYSVECQTATHMVYLKSMLDFLGPEKFNQSYGKMTVFGRLLRCNITESKFYPGAAVLKFKGSVKEAVDVNAPPLAGDWVYFYNPQGPEQAKKNNDYCWYGENAIALPNGKYYAHGADRDSRDRPLGLLSAQQIIEKIHRYGNNSKGSKPFLSDKIGQLSPAHLLDH